MTKKNIQAGAAGYNSQPSSSQDNQVQKQSDNKRKILYGELKRSGSMDIPVKYTETHLEGGEENLE